MIEIIGEVNSAIVYTNQIEVAAQEQIRTMCNFSFTEGSKIRVMPDVHAGKGCTIGTTMTIKDKAVPNVVGVDIGCGVDVIHLKQKRIEFQKLDRLIHQEIPSGFDIRRTPHRYAEDVKPILQGLRIAKHVNIEKALHSIATLGSGNHYLELDKDEQGDLYLVIHTGSRHLGVEIAEWYQRAAYEQTSKFEDIPYELSYVYGNLFDDYIHDMSIAQHFAAMNRLAIADVIIKGMKFKIENQFSSVHNYIDTLGMILRKGAVSAREGEPLIIPINMRDGALICIGKGNDEWNFSAPHGAGRLLSRKEAKESFTVNEFKHQMKGIYSTTINKDTLDECPMAYKSMADIVANIEPTAEIVSVLKPVYNFKAG